MATFAPSLAKSSAVASPIPEVPPVMSAILFFRRIEVISPKPCPGDRRVLRGLFFGCSWFISQFPPGLSRGLHSIAASRLESCRAQRRLRSPQPHLSAREPPRRLPPVHRVNLAGGVRRVIRRQVREQGRDLLRL